MVDPPSAFAKLALRAYLVRTKDGSTVLFHNSFLNKKDYHSIVKWAERAILYGGREQNCHCQTGSKSLYSFYFYIQFEDLLALFDSLFIFFFSTLFKFLFSLFTLFIFFFFCTFLYY